MKGYVRGISDNDDMIDWDEEIDLIRSEKAMLERIENKLDYLLEQFKRFQPLLQRYEMASQANSRLGARKVMKGK